MVPSSPDESLLGMTRQHVSTFIEHGLPVKGEHTVDVAGLALEIRAQDNGGPPNWPGGPEIEPKEST